MNSQTTYMFWSSSFYLFLLQLLIGIKFLRRWPFLGRVRVCFVEPPYFQMTIKPIFTHGLDVTVLPGIAGWLVYVLSLLKQNQFWIPSDYYYSTPSFCVYFICMTCSFVYSVSQEKLLSIAFEQTLVEVWFFDFDTHM